MSLNTLQKQVIQATLDYMFHAIIEGKPIEQVILCLQAIFKEEIYQANKDKFAQLDMLESLDQIRGILVHPCPQNRSTGCPYVGQEPGMVVYRDASHNICREPKGLLSLTALNDTSHSVVTKQDVVEYLQILVNERLLDSQNICLRQLQQARERDVEEIHHLEIEIMRLRATITISSMTSCSTDTSFPNFFQTPSDILLAQARERLTQRDHMGAVHYLDILVSRDPIDPEYRYLRGRSLAILDRRAEALTDFNIAIRYRSNHAQSYVERGFTLEKLGVNDAALKDYTQAIALEPTHAFALCQRAGIYMEMGRRAEALAGYAASLNVKEDANTYNNRGNWLLVLEQYSEAINDFNDSLRLRPNQPQVEAMRQEAQRKMTGTAAASVVNSDEERTGSNRYCVLC
jgi:tetratricopeptide (TPR) repeat protein